MPRKMVFHPNNNELMIAGTRFLSNWEINIFSSLADNTHNLSVSDITKNSYFTVYPNPSNGKFYLKNELLNNPSDIEVYDFIGKTIILKKMSRGDNLIDLSAYSDGLYFLKIKELNEVIKIIKK